MKTIKVYTGESVLVDDEDYELVSQLKWNLAHGYVSHCITVGSKQYQERLHRLIMGLKPYESGTVDHINGDKLDNRKSNLRVCTQAQNNMNTPIRVRNRSGFKGVSWKKSCQKWCAQISKSRCVIHIGLFDSKEAAATAYNKKALELHGEFARLNKV